MPNAEEEQQALEAAFAEEADERFVRLAQALQTLAIHPADEAAVNLCFREVHSLKGAALVVGYEALGQIAHLMENRMAGARSGEQPLDAADVARLTQAADGLPRLIAHDADGTPLARVLAGEPAFPVERDSALAEEEEVSGAVESVRVATSRLDVLLDQSGELIVANTRTRQRLAELRNQAETLPARERENMQTLCRLASEDWARAEGLAFQMEENVRQLRLLPLRSLFESLPRTVREAARHTDKTVRLEIEGADVEVDKIILERLKDPLMHLLRNAVDHGVESPSERMLLAKRRDGLIRLRARLEGNFTVIEVIDDGSGMDRDRILAKAESLGLVKPSEAGAWTDAQVYQLVFRPGFSTSETVSELSGRGVGMDVVSRNVGSIDGTIEIVSVANEGSTIRLLLPTRLTTAPMLVLRAGGERFVLPLSGVDTLTIASEQSVYQSASGSVLLAGGDLVPLIPLAGALGLRTSGGYAGPAPNHRPVVIVRVADRRLGFLVDELEGEQDVVIKRFQPPLVRTANFSASTILPDGKVSLILNPADLALSAKTGAAVFEQMAPGSAPSRTATILVVDDSVTARALQRNVLGAAGYHVDVAVDGLDAWDKLRRETYDLVITDVDMPNVTGFELTERIRSNPRLARLPVVVVTSMESDSDKRRGMEVGADAYIVKRAFDHQALLETVRRLI